jgi:DNA-binding LytR/AlgR family response regulator
MSKPKVIFHKLKMAVPEGRGLKIIPYADILWLQHCDHFTQLVCRDNKPARYIYESLNELGHNLPPVFYRCHRSVIVNLCYIQSFNLHGVHINNHILPVSQKNKTEIRRLLKKSERLTFPLCNTCDSCPELNTCPIIRPFTARKVT